MMRRLQSVLWAGLAIALTAMPAAAQTEATRIAYLDARMLLAEAPGASEAQAAFERDMARFQTELEGLETELDTMIRDYERQQVMLTTEQRQQRENAIRQKQQEFQRRVEQLEEQAAARQAELVNPIMDRITQVIESFRQENGFAMILDLNVGSIVAADPSLDVTEQVLARLRAQASNP